MSEPRLEKQVLSRHDNKTFIIFILNMQPVCLEFAYFTETLKSARIKIIVLLTHGDQSLLMKEFSISYFTYWKLLTRNSVNGHKKKQKTFTLFFLNTSNYLQQIKRENWLIGFQKNVFAALCPTF